MPAVLGSLSAMPCRQLMHMLKLGSIAPVRSSWAGALPTGRNMGCTRVAISWPGCTPEEQVHICHYAAPSLFRAAPSTGAEKV